MTAEVITVPIQRLPHAPDALPGYQTDGAVGMDLQAAITEPIVLPSLGRALVPTGYVIALPGGYEAQIRARSGLSVKHGIALINGVGTIDWDYRNEVKVGLVNLSDRDYTIMPGDRIAQLVIAPVTRAEWLAVPDITPVADDNAVLARQGGFGSTGI